MKKPEEKKKGKDIEFLPLFFSLEDVEIRFVSAVNTKVKILPAHCWQEKEIDNSGPSTTKYHWSFI